MCESCFYAQFDYDLKEFTCSIDFFIDEDDFSKLSYVNEFNNGFCPYYRCGDEYTLVNKQI